MIDVQKVNATKEKIINVIKTSGPSFPTRISREAGVSPLFIGALLSEMIAEKRVVMSAMKVGSSPLYLIPGQEPQLENFTQHLNGKEREAVARLKERKLLEDDAEDPAIRVALRKLKDFAIPMIVRDEETEKLYWKFFGLSDEEARKMLEARIAPRAREEKQKKVEEQPIAKEESKEEKVTPPLEKPAKKKADKKPSAFGNNIKEYLATKHIEVLEDLAAKAKEYNARIKVNTPLGEQEFLLLAKEKKKLTEDDLAIALHKAQLEKMPAFIIATGDLDKTAKPYLDQWKNLLKFEKIKL